MPTYLHPPTYPQCGGTAPLLWSMYATQQVFKHPIHYHQICTVIQLQRADDRSNKKTPEKAPKTPEKAAAGARRRRAGGQRAVRGGEMAEPEPEERSAEADNVVRRAPVTRRHIPCISVFSD